MLKIAGWVITPDAAEAWVASHPEVKMLAPKYRAPIRGMTAIALQEFFEARHPKDWPPIIVDSFQPIGWPKDTLDAPEKLICLLTRRCQNVEDETWDKFKPIRMKPEDVHVRKLLEDDGLIGELEWITVPDPFEEDWPFRKRYPGK